MSDANGKSEGKRGGRDRIKRPGKIILKKILKKVLPRQRELLQRVEFFEPWEETCENLTSFGRTLWRLRLNRGNAGCALAHFVRS
ncbi:MAG: hypothetical protein DME60_09880 [Verrucomicrobia bacterium]|nr:MAG: hypothetical protein DME60_09880 [Verrucomicrobiota bacterium]